MHDSGRHILTLFGEALELGSPEERVAYLDRTCGNDAALRARLEALLRAADEAGGFLGGAASASEPDTAGLTPAESPGTRLGPYKLLEQVGEGGMGTVWMAEQEEPVRRRIALKIIKPGMDSQHVFARFEAERQALALMDHPHIAKVFDAGTTDSGRPYFVMELIKGTPITRYCDEQRLTPRQRLELFLPVCQALQHAHQKGIIHRDVKPSNVLVAPYDGAPVVKVIDFGVAKAAGAKLTEKTLFTGFGAVVGTLEYMAPEQAELNNHDIDTRSDIYSLGVLLYELLTGTTPLDRKHLKDSSVLELLRRIREEEPPKPSTRLSLTTEELPAVAAKRGLEPKKLSGLVRGELDWIVMKCLEKDRNRRYETANSLAHDIERYLHDEPVLACPPSAAYRLRKFARKHRKGLATAAGFALLLVAAATMSIGLAAWALRAESETRQALEDVQSAKQKTDTALDRETAARKRTRQTMARFSDRVMEATFARQEQLTEEDKKFLREILQEYEAFAAEQGDRAEARALRAEGLSRVGSLRRYLGELTDAETAFRAALDIWTELTADFPAVPEYRRDLAKDHQSLGVLLQVTSRPPEAEAAFRAAVEIWAKLAVDSPAVPEYRRELARSLNGLGNLLHETSRPSEAETALRVALDIRAKLAADFSAVAAHWQDLASSQHSLGILLRATGRSDEAEAAYRAALEIRAKLAADFPGVPWHHHELARSHNTLGILLRATRKPKDAKDALTAFRAAVGIWTKLAADFPTVPLYRKHLAGSYNNLGLQLRAARRFKEAEAAYRAALEIWDKLAAGFPTVNAYRHELAISHNNLGVLLQADDRLDDAEVAYRAALEIRRKLVAELPDRHDLHNELAGTFVNLAGFACARKDFAAGRRLLEEARPHHQAALRAYPDHPSYREYWRNNRGNLCHALAGLRDHVELAKTAQELAANGFDPAADTYFAAGFVARCVPLAHTDALLAAEERTELARHYADQAVSLLRQAIAQGYENVAQLKKDADLAALGMREDFQKLLKELEARTKQ